MSCDGKRALEIAVDERGKRLPIAGEALLGLSDIRREWNDLEAAARLAQEGIELSRLWSWPSAITGSLTLARILQAQGKEAESNQVLEAARRLAVQYDLTNIDDLAVAFVQAHMRVEQGDVETALGWARERGFDGPLDLADLDKKDDYVAYHVRKYEYLVAARVWIAHGDADKALALVEPLVARMEQQGRTRHEVEARMLQALALQAQGKPERARDALKAALRLAEPGGLIRLFADEGRPMEHLLKSMRADERLSMYAARILAALEDDAGHLPALLSSQSKSPLVEPLSEREQEVLRLLAAGLANPEIAQELTVTVHTVRSHVKSIYGKLSVHSRWEAAQRARELGLL